MDTHPTTPEIPARDSILVDEIEKSLERLETVDAPESAEVASELARTLSSLLDQVETV